MELKITFSGRFNYKKGKGIMPHHHSDYQIQLVYAGKGLTQLNNSRFTIQLNDIVLTRKGSIHSFQSTSPEGMKTLEAKFTTDNPEIETMLDHIELLSCDQDRKIYNLLARIVFEGQRKSIHYRPMSEALLMESLLHMSRFNMENNFSTFETVSAKTPKLHNVQSPVLNLVDDYIARNINHKFSLRELAESCGYNQDYLYRVIKKETGSSLITYINQVRFERAKSVIQHTELTLTEIAWNLGFESIQYFTRFFKQHGGMTPSEYLTKVRTTIRTDY